MNRQLFKQIVIESHPFDLELAFKIAKLKYKECPEFLIEYKQEFDDSEPATFKDICFISNIETRRKLMQYLTIEDIVKQVNPKLIDRQVLTKTKNYYDENSLHINHEYDDAYELYEIEGSVYNLPVNLHFVKCWCTTTNREYLIWVDKREIERINSEFDAISAIAWTFRTSYHTVTNIIRQGDCILIQGYNHNDYFSNQLRPITKYEYLNTLTLES